MLTNSVGCLFNYKEKQKNNIRCQTNNVKGGIKLLAQQALWPIFERSEEHTSELQSQP